MPDAEVWSTRRFERTGFENAIVEFRALSNIGDSYIAPDANCEHDMTKAQFGVAFSPTADNAKLLGGALAVLALMKCLD